MKETLVSREYKKIQIMYKFLFELFHRQKQRIINTADNVDLEIL